MSVSITAPLARSEPSMGDLAPMRTAHAIVGVQHDGRGVTLEWSDGRQSRFPALWLRDNCACPECRHPQALERTYMFIDHGGPRITAARGGGESGLEVEFESGGTVHVSRYAQGFHGGAGRARARAAAVGCRDQ
jgi:gamma-butyrobetaine dioxygenase